MEFKYCPNCGAKTPLGTKTVEKCQKCGDVFDWLAKHGVSPSPVYPFPGVPDPPKKVAKSQENAPAPRSRLQKMMDEHKRKKSGVREDIQENEEDFYDDEEFPGKTFEASAVEIDVEIDEPKTVKLGEIATGKVEKVVRERDKRSKKAIIAEFLQEASSQKKPSL